MAGEKGVVELLRLRTLIIGDILIRQGQKRDLVDR